jgi:hypothetical protein
MKVLHDIHIILRSSTKIILNILIHCCPHILFYKPHKVRRFFVLLSPSNFNQKRKMSLWTYVSVLRVTASKGSVFIWMCDFCLFSLEISHIVSPYFRIKGRQVERIPL